VSRAASATPEGKPGRYYRMAMAQELDVPPSALFADILSTIIGNIVATVNRFDTVAAVTLKPSSPNHLP